MTAGFIHGSDGGISHQTRARPARHPEDLRAVPLFREPAEGWMGLFALAQAGEYPEFPAAKKDLAVLISRTCFRPRVVRGEFGDSPVRVRYYLN